MDTSIFLAKALSLYFIIISISAFINRAYMLSVMNEAINQPHIMLFRGVLTLMLGIILILMHNIWEPTWHILITLICWLTFIVGAYRVLFPHLVIKMQKNILQSSKKYTIIIAIVFCFGIMLGFFGFM